MHRPAITMRVCITLIRRLINRGRYLSKRDRLYRSLSIVRLKKVAIKRARFNVRRVKRSMASVYDDVVMDLCFMLPVPLLALNIFGREKY